MTKLVESFLAGRAGPTQKAYRAGLEALMVLLGSADVESAAAELFAMGHVEANNRVEDLKLAMIDKGQAAATINRQLSILRSLSKWARRRGRMGWAIEVSNVRLQPHRDTRGPGHTGFLAMLDQLRKRGDAKAARDRAILRLLYERALRCCEVVRLDMEDLDLERQSISILGKGRTAKEPATIAASTVTALQEWITARGPQPGPVFVNLDRAHAPRRLSGTAVYDLVRELGEAVGIRARPHGLVNAGITEALDRGNDVRAVRQFCRRQDIRSVIAADQTRKDLAGDVARSMARQRR